MILTSREGYNKRNIARRLYLQHVNWIKEEWNNVLCIDESKFKFFSLNLRLPTTVEKD